MQTQRSCTSVSGPLWSIHQQKSSFTFWLKRLVFFLWNKVRYCSKPQLKPLKLWKAFDPKECQKRIKIRTQNHIQREREMGFFQVSVWTRIILPSFDHPHCLKSGEYPWDISSHILFSCIFNSKETEKLACCRAM